jgi:serine/threonine protein kinase
MAPEILLSNQYDCKVDVYSFGATFLEVLAKERPKKEGVIGMRGVKIDIVGTYNQTITTMEVID